MDTPSGKSDAPQALPILPSRILVKKLLGMLIGALVGIPIGWLIGHYEYSWVTEDRHYFLIAGGLAGAVMGALLPGRTLGMFGWAIVLGTGCGGCFLPPNSKASPPFVTGAACGFVAGFLVGLILESYGRFTAPRNRQQ